MNPAPADFLLQGGVVWTGRPGRPTVEAVAVAGKRIVAAGPAGELDRFAGPGTRVIELAGRMVAPGLVDAHTHFVDGGFRLGGLRLRDAADPAELVERIAEYAAELPPGRWITGGSWDHERWGGELPDRSWIDPVTPEHPVLVSRLDLHMALANERALRTAGIGPDTASPPGGEIVRDDAGRATGLLRDAAIPLVSRAIPEPSDRERDDALRVATRHALERGLTGVHVMGSWADLAAFRRARESEGLGIRVYAYLPLESWPRVAEEVDRTGRGDEWLRIGGVKGFVDGSLGSRTALFRDPYPGATGGCGLRVTPPDVLRERLEGAVAADLQVAVHAIGDAANGWILDRMEALARGADRDRIRFRVEHAQHLAREDVSRFARLGVVASVQPSHAIDDGRWAAGVLGPERARQAFPLRSLRDAGATLAFGSDWTVAPLDPLVGLYAAVTRRTEDGAHPGGWIPEQRIGIEEALAAYTRGSAYAGFSEGERGTLEEGKLADLVVLDRDLLAASGEEILATGVDLTMIGGRVAYEREGATAGRPGVTPPGPLPARGGSRDGA